MTGSCGSASRVPTLFHQQYRVFRWRPNVRWHHDDRRRILDFADKRTSFDRWRWLMSWYIVNSRRHRASLLVHRLVHHFSWDDRECSRRLRGNCLSETGYNHNVAAACN